MQLMQLLTSALILRLLTSRLRSGDETPRSPPARWTSRDLRGSPRLPWYNVRITPPRRSAAEQVEPASCCRLKRQLAGFLYLVVYPRRQKRRGDGQDETRQQLHALTPSRVRGDAVAFRRSHVGGGSAPLIVAAPLWPDLPRSPRVPSHPAFVKVPASRLPARRDCIIDPWL